MDAQIVISESTDRINLRTLHERLGESGIAIAYTSLFEMVKHGDMESLLGARKEGRNLTFPGAAASLLSAFLPNFQAMGGRPRQAPLFLREFLEAQERSPEGQNGHRNSNGNGVRLLSAPESVETAAERRQLALECAEAQGLAESGNRILTAAEAAAFMRTSPKLLRQAFPPYVRLGSSARGDRWRLRDLVGV